MIGYWISFGLIFILIPFGVVGIKRLVLNNNQLTSKQVKLVNNRAFLLMLLYWLCDLFYMSLFINSKLWQFIFGGILLVIIFMNLAQSFSYPIKRSNFSKVGMIQDFIIGIGLTIYLIFIIPNEEVKTITIPIVAAVYGGFITLIGVSWTIKKSDIDRKEDEIRKAKPLLFIVDSRTVNKSMGNPINKFLFSEKNGGTLKQADKECTSYSLPDIYLSNADYSHCSVWGFRVNDDIHVYDYGQVIPKNCFMHLMSSYEFKFNDEIKYVSLLIKDMLDNVYELELNYSIDGTGKQKFIQILSGIEIKRTDLIFTYEEVEHNANK